jgi:hypothetical protein
MTNTLKMRILAFMEVFINPKRVKVLEYIAKHGAMGQFEVRATRRRNINMKGKPGKVKC